MAKRGQSTLELEMNFPASHDRSHGVLLNRSQLVFCLYSIYRLGDLFQKQATLLLQEVVAYQHIQDVFRDYSLHVDFPYEVEDCVLTRNLDVVNSWLAEQSALFPEAAALAHLDDTFLFVFIHLSHYGTLAIEDEVQGIISLPLREDFLVPPVLRGMQGICNPDARDAAVAVNVGEELVNVV
eukprot:CAMPEP_0204910340 /NCGR_PEP_ID=MMETSP1397-20131031/8893_1 /ASSEMBLY_ACC=CAM_ASM_000891 /TAXON_ID=49980 /ORGANISM="Climacostomum Climacostomum virens, Strain Stock W-24" /LENGTH=181 /DNA_ID=CAMNT_0052080473 /DNA_START=265 /DNA_END=810 /DNA_ORIENTATION=+